MSKSVNFSIAALILFSGCSFSAPDFKQQQELLSRGSFAGTTPEWVLQPRRGVADVAAPQQGLLPTAYTSSGVGRDMKAPERMATEIPAVTAAEREAAKKGGGAKISSEAVGPLNKLVEKCPFIEDKTRETLVMEDIGARISSWNGLISQCPAGSALYYWLGQDYEKAGKLPEAGRNYEQALTLDHLNVDAAAALDELRKKQQPQ
jgi:hypothetical protein